MDKKKNDIFVAHLQSKKPHRGMTVLRFFSYLKMFLIRIIISCFKLDLRFE